MWDRFLVWDLLNHQPASAAGQARWRWTRWGMVSISQFKGEKQGVDVCDNDLSRRNINTEITVLNRLLSKV